MLIQEIKIKANIRPPNLDSPIFNSHLMMPSHHHNKLVEDDAVAASVPWTMLSMGGTVCFGDGRTVGIEG
jgi:hypothetical protein